MSSTALVLVLLTASTNPRGTALEQLSERVASSVHQAGLEAPIALWLGGTAPPELRAAVGSLLSARLAELKLPTAPLEASGLDEAERAARASGSRTVIRLTLELEATRLAVRGDVLSTWVNFWSGRVSTRSGPALAVSEQVSLEELQAFASVDGGAPQTAPLKLSLTWLAKLSGLPAALAVSPSSKTVAVLVNDEVQLVSALGKVLGRYELRSALASPRQRLPLGALAFTGSSQLVVASIRRSKAEVLNLAGNEPRLANSIDVFATNEQVLRFDPNAGAFSAEVQLRGKPLTLGGPFHALTSVGAETLVLYPDGLAALLSGGGGFVSEVGSGSTMGDVDGDGTLELIVSAHRSSGDTDELRVVSRDSFARLQAQLKGNLGQAAPLFTQPVVRGRVMVAASGPLDEVAGDEVVLGTWSSDGSGELWLLRKAAP